MYFGHFCLQLLKYSSIAACQKTAADILMVFGRVFNDNLSSMAMWCIDAKAHAKVKYSVGGWEL